MHRTGRYRTGRRFAQLVALDAALAAQTWALRLGLLSETCGHPYRFSFSSKIRRIEGTRALIAERLNEILVYGKIES